ncbi:unnamed protein product [Caenorhabditis angaria]|uniref:DUF38 domain-containing protein n=1 Tax=Caenorhabditis angaria TaxID=860376 RepID=A0A9P1IY71_9PELO|nr:unnamed protein product [Caenorhabditis angaria]
MKFFVILLLFFPIFSTQLFPIHEIAKGYLISLYDHYLARNPTIIHPFYMQITTRDTLVMKDEFASEIMNFSDSQLEEIKWNKKQMEADWEKYFFVRRLQFIKNGMLQIEEFFNNGSVSTVFIAKPFENITGGFRSYRQYPGFLQKNSVSFNATTTQFNVSLLF